MMKRLMAGTSILLSMITFFGIAFLGCKDEIPQKEMIRPVRAMQIADPAEFAKRWFPGQAKAIQEVDLSFRVAGPLITLPAMVGDTVRKGQELAKIDPRDFQVDLRSSQARLDKAKALLTKAETDYERLIRIQKRDAGAVSQAQVDSNQQKVESSRAEIRSLQAAVDSAQDRLDYTYLKAPYDGLITATYVENYEGVKAKQPIVRLIDHSQIEMIVNIPESMISHADYLKSAGNVLRVRFDPFPDREMEAWIKEIGKEASRTTRTYPVTLLMDQPDDIKILPGMAGNAASTAPPSGMQDQPQLVIPETAVFSPGENKTVVWIIDEKSQKASQREVKTGKLLGSGITVLEGIQPGEWIATAGVHYLKEGQQVRILSASTEEVAK